jgi:hypothetical protein
MDTIIFLPGGGGSILELAGDQVWPPSILEFCTHYGRLQELLDPSVQATDIIDSIPPHELIAVPVYRQLVEDLTNISGKTGASFVPFPYDFRKSVFDSALALKATIRSCYSNGSRSITLVAHSTGNQVARAVLEYKMWHGQAWFSGIKRYVGICGPHFGAPEVLEYGLGRSKRHANVQSGPPIPRHVPTFPL